MSEVQQSHAITIKSSSELVAEFFNYGINSILYQRGVYPPDSFERIEEYGIPLQMTSKEDIKKYMAEVLGKIKGWLLNKQVERLVLLLQNVDTSEVMERWEFKIDYEDDDKEGEKNTIDKSKLEKGSKELKKIQKEIRDVIRQVIASVALLPLLDCVCSFDILTYVKHDTQVPEQWGDAGPGFITNSEELQLKSFSTGFHKVQSVVSYKVDS